MEIYITCLLQILSSSSRFRRFEMKNFLHRPTIMADNISWLVAAPQNLFFISTGLHMSFFNKERRFVTLLEKVSSTDFFL